MVNQTTEIAIKALTLLAVRGEDAAPMTPARIAPLAGCSPTYLSKVMGQLVKARLLTAQRGPMGGMRLARSPANITLLDIVEACQGRLVADCCTTGEDESPIDPCRYHQAMQDVFSATREALERWTLADLASNRDPSSSTDCRMSFLWRGEKRG